MTVFISLPMHERGDQEVLSDIQVATDAIKRIFVNDNDLKIFHSRRNYNSCNVENLWYLGQDIILLGSTDVVYFCHGWENAKDCQIEHHVCELYGIQRIEAE